MTALLDDFGRIATDMRVSVTDRCNFRCTYCMPEEGLDWTPQSGILTFDEIVRVVRAATTVGVRTVRLTGGEPLVRKGLPSLVRELAKLDLDDISMTTNGVLLKRQAADLAAAGLHRVNVSLDSLQQHRFSLMTRRDELDAVMSGIAAAAAAGLAPLKINCVVLRGINDDEIVQFAELARNTDAGIRFIEYLPLDADKTWKQADVVPSTEVIAAVNAVFPLTPHDPKTTQPATTYRFTDGAPGSVGVIPSVTAPFCSSCDRVRLTCDGQFRTCLFANDETDLRTILRDGGTDDELAHAMVISTKAKQAGHGIGTNVFIRPTRSMSMIGG